MIISLAIGTIKPPVGGGLFGRISTGNGAGPASDYVHGAILNLDGGWLTR